MLLYYKAQLYCICILLIMLSMCVGGIKERNKENGLFNKLLIFALINMCFDIASNYTVNHLHMVLPIVNRVVHICFFISMTTLFLLVYKYLEIIIEKELDAKLVYKKWTYIPYGLVCVLTLFLPIYYMEEPSGNWSYGPGPNAVYVCVGIYVVLIIRLLIKYNKKISKKNKNAIIIALSCELIAAVFQMIVPAALTSSLGVILLCLCTYSTIANPDAVLVRLLKEQTERADAANRAKSDFLAKMSHEIRTPINAVLGMNEMIIRESGEQDIKKYAADIKGSAHNLLGIINEILDSSKIESGKMVLSQARYDMASLLYDIQNMFDIKAKEKGLELNFEVDRFIPSEYYGDDLRIKQVLINILNNAIKYTPSGSVTVKLKGRREGDNEILTFTVKDTGVGIKEEDVEKLFAKYTRIEDRQNRYVEGTGLGINIVIQLLKLMGSELKVNSLYGEGSEFYFDIVQKIENEEAIGDFRDKALNVYEEDEYVSEYIAPNAKILVVDDNAMNRKVFRNFIKHTQIQLTEASSGLECLELVKENDFDVIFLDHMMPEMDGIETLHTMRNRRMCDDIPVIVLTANAVKGAKAHYLREGFSDFLSKPILPEKLDKILLEYIPKDLLIFSENDLGSSKKENKEESREITLEVAEFDFEYALKILGSEELLMDTLKDFYNMLKTLPNKLDDLFDNISNEEGLKNYRIEVHALKSVAATVGAILLSKLARIIESAATNNEEDKVMILHSILIEEIEKHRERLGDIFEETTIESKELDVNTINMYLQMMKASLTNKEYNVTDYLFGEISVYEYPEEVRKDIEKLKNYIANLMWEEAIEMINTISNALSEI
mgnify:CR=1 FL=1